MSALVGLITLSAWAQPAGCINKIISLTENSIDSNAVADDLNQEIKICIEEALGLETLAALQKILPGIRDRGFITPADCEKDLAMIVLRQVILDQQLNAPAKDEDTIVETAPEAVKPMIQPVKKTTTLSWLAEFVTNYLPAAKAEAHATQPAANAENDQPTTFQRLISFWYRGQQASVENTQTPITQSEVPTTVEVIAEEPVVVDQEAEQAPAEEQEEVTVTIIDDEMDSSMNDQDRAAMLRLRLLFVSGANFEDVLQSATDFATNHQFTDEERGAFLESVTKCSEEPQLEGTELQEILIQSAADFAEANELNDEQQATLLKSVTALSEGQTLADADKKAMEEFLASAIIPAHVAPSGQSDGGLLSWILPWRWKK